MLYPGPQPKTLNLCVSSALADTNWGCVEQLLGLGFRVSVQG